MSAPKILEGVVHGGVVVLDDPTDLRDGTRVRIIAQDLETLASLRDEFVAWDKAGADAWRLIDQWEKEEAVEPW